MNLIFCAEPSLDGSDFITIDSITVRVVTAITVKFF